MFLVDKYYNDLKEYEKLLDIYNKKYNIYKNNKIEFPKSVNIITHMIPKLLGIDKPHIQLLFILLVITIIIYYFLKTNNINFKDELFT